MAPPAARRPSCRQPNVCQPHALLRASQDFDPRTRQVINRGQLLGASLAVSAAGSYEPADAAATCPKLVRASIGGGSLQAWGRQIQLPIR